MSTVVYHSDIFPPKNLDWNKLIPLIGPANAAIARFDGVLAGMINSKVLLSPLTTQEAALSSKIEGTEAEFVEVLIYEAGEELTYKNQEEKEKKEGDIQEIINYRTAVRIAENQLDSLPLSGRFIRKIHKRLMKGVRGRNKAPGEFRKIQNWIGPKGCKIDNAHFVPINSNQLSQGITKWEKYLNSQQPDVLVQLAIIHVEFEALHPFLDGNGRLGRMLIPIFLYHRKLLSAPTFYLSEFLEANREEYIERLLSVSRDNDWTGWCVFFLNAILEQADKNIDKAKNILKLYESKKMLVKELTHSQYAIHALDFIFDRPIFSSSAFVNHSSIPKPTAKKIVKSLRDSKLLSVLLEASGRRSSILAFNELLNIAEGKKVF